MAFGPKRVPGLYECVESNGTPKMQAAGSSLDEPDMSVQFCKAHYTISHIRYKLAAGDLGVLWACDIKSAKSSCTYVGMPRVILNPEISHARSV